MTKTLLIRKEWKIIFYYILISLLFFIFVGRKVMINELEFQFYADSKTYVEEAKSSNFDLISVGGNFLGPVSILKILGPENYFMAYLFNVMLFMIAIIIMTRDRDINLGYFLFLTIVNPITFTSLISINKEILSLLFVSILISEHKRLHKRHILTILNIVLALMVRWQLAIFYIVYLIIFSRLNFFSKNRFLVILSLLIVISVTLNYTQEALSSVFDIYERTLGEYTEGAGSFDLIMTIQFQYGYIYAFIPKILHLLLGLLSRYKLYFDFTDAYNNFILFNQALLNLYLLYKVFKDKYMRLNNDFLYISIVYCSIFAITPIYAMRYFYPISILITYGLSINKQLKSNEDEKH